LIELLYGTVLIAVGLSAALALLYVRLRSVEQRLSELVELITYRVLPSYRLVRVALAELARTSRGLKALERAARRPRRRYVAFYVVAEDGRAPDPKSLEDSIKRAVRQLAGTLGLAEANVDLVYYDPEKPAGIVRTTNTAKHVVIASLALVRSVDGRRVMLIPVRTAGTIKRAKRAIQQTR
jgi:ribonuclease P/MRP protein subunit POP5